jgi:hypothetical protein
MSEDPSAQGLNPQDFSDVGRYADMMRIHGQPLQDYIQSNSQDNSLPSAGDNQNDILDYYEQNKNRMLDLDAPDAEKNWNEIKGAFADRHTDYLKLFGDTASEIASLPLTLVEGMAENPNPAVWAGSTIEGTGRAIRDMWGLAAQSENPTSPLFRFKSAINALVNGKPSANWREEAQQWNDARKFLWHSTKIQNGDEVLLDQLTKLNDSDRQTIQSFVNPKIAHAMGYIGLELPAILSSAWTGGAGAVAAMEAGSSLISAGTRAAEAAKVGKSLGGLATKFENYASRLAGKMATGTVGAVGGALEGPATFVGNIIGGTTEGIASKIGRSSAEVRNIAESAALDLGREIGAGEVQATVGILGSLGLRTFSEVAKEIGYQGALRASGVVESSGMSGLTLLEKVATSPLSKSGQAAAKFLSYTVDPVLQMSTSALKASYKGGLEFATLGYLNDRDKGAISGAAMGMVWSGYSGAVRHLWSVANGGMSHALIIKNFDERSLPHYEKLNPEFATVARTLIADADRMGSSKISANVRTVLQMAADAARDRLKDVYIHIGDAKSFGDYLVSKGIDPIQAYKHAHSSQYGHASFTTYHDALAGKERGLMFINDGGRGHRSADVAHEIMGHMLNKYMLMDGHMPEFFHQFFGSKRDGGVIPDQHMIDYASQMAATTMTLINKDMVNAEYRMQTGREPSPSDQSYLDFFNKKAKANYELLRGHFRDNVINVIRDEFPTMSHFLGKDLYSNVMGDVRDPAYAEIHDFQMRTGVRFGAQYLFEEIIASRSEHLFMHTNLASMTTPDAMMPVRMLLEAKRDSLFASNVTHMELAGMRVSNNQFIDANGSPSFQTMAHTYDNGKMVRWQEMDSFIKSYVKKAINSDAQPVSRLSPERQAIEARRFGKEFLFNAAKAGMTMKGTKDVNEILAERSRKGFEVLTSLDESIRPEVIVDQHGNGRIDMTRLNPAAWDALVKSGCMDEATATYGRAIADVMRHYEETGFSTPNIMTGVYWGDSHEIIRNGLLERLRGSDVPITHRVFVPFEMNMTQRITDANGRRLKSPKHSLNVTAIDYLAIHRRKIKAWSRGDVQAVFSDIGHMNRTFDSYMINMMSEPSIRVPSEELFFSEFGPKAAQVRDICHQIFGAVKRGDESYINTPSDGHVNVRGPNFPINSFKLELMVDVARSPSMPFPYHHGRSYEGFRRNLSVAGFEKVGKNERYMNANGYEILKNGSKFKVFNPFGVLMDVVDSIAKGAKIADRDIRKMDPADRMPAPSESSVNPISDLAEKVSYKDAAGMYKSNFGPDGAMLSTAGYTESGEEIKFREKLRNDWDYLDAQIMSNKAIYKDLLEEESAKSLDGFNKEFNDGHYDIGNMGVVPMTQAKGRSTGISYKNTGSYFRLIWSEEQRTFSVNVDMEHLRSIPDKSARIELLRAALDERSMALSQSMRGKFPIKSVFVEPTEKVFSHNVDSDVKIANGYKNATAKSVEESQSKSASEYAESIKWLSKSGVNALTEGTYDMSDKDAKAIYSRYATELRKIPKQDVESYKEGVVKICELALAIKESKFGTVIDSEGKERSAPSYQDKEGKISSKISELRRFLDDKESSVVESCYRVGGEILHGLFQRVDDTPNADMGSEGRNYPNMAINFIDATHESLNQSSEHPVYIFSVSRGVGIATPTLEIVTIESGKNKFRGFKGGRTLGSQKERVKQPRGFNKNTPRADGLSSITAFPAQVADMVSGSQISKRAIDRINHGHTVAAIINYCNEGVKDDVYNLFKKYESDSDRMALLEGLRDVAVENKITAAIVPAYGAIQLEKAMDQEAVRSRLSLITQYDEQKFDDWNARVKREAMATWNQSLSHYWASGKSGETALHMAVNSLYGAKMFKDFMSEADLSSIRSHIEKVASLNEKCLETATITSEPSPLLSIAGIQSIKDELRISELFDLGLVRRMYDRNGNVLNVFEFSDKEAGLNMDKNGNKPFLTPFVGEKNPEFAFANYQKLTEGGIITNKELSTSKLGDVFEHSTLYFYYPEMKDMKVEFFDGFGAQYAPPHCSGGERIRLGARMFCASEIMRSMGSKEMGNYLRSKDSLLEKFASKNPAASVILHEVQHALQERSKGMDRSIPLNKVTTGVLLGYFANLMGIEGSVLTKDMQTAKMQSMFGKDSLKKALKGEEPWVDVDSFYDKAMHDDPTAADKTIMALGDSPVFRSLHDSARPILTSALGHLAGFCAEYHDRGAVPINFAERAIRLFEESKGVVSDDRLFDMVTEFEELGDIANKFPEWSVYQIGDTQYKAARTMMGVYSSISLIKNDKSVTATEKLTLLRHAVSSFANATYLMDISESMARETQRRAGMSNVEIATNHRTDTGNFMYGSTLDLIDRAMSSSAIIKPSEISKALRDSYDGKSGNIGIVMNSIGGLTSGKDDNRMIASLGKAMLVHYFGFRAGNELTKLNRVAVAQRGWEVGEDGRVTLSDKTYMLKGNVEKFNETFAKGGIPMNMAGYTEGHSRTITIGDICRLADVVIESESGISVGNPVMDMVLSSTFPDKLKGGEIIQHLIDRGFSPDDDAVTMSKIYHIANEFNDIELTRHDITNLIALRHSFIESSSIQHGKEGTLPSTRPLTIENINKNKAIPALSGTALGNESVQKNIGYRLYTPLTKNHFNVGAYKFKQGILSFEPEKPFWVEQDVFDKAVEKHINGPFHERLRKLTTGREAENIDQVAYELNKRLAHKLLIIEPIMKQCMDWALNQKDSGNYAEFIAGLLDDAFVSSLEISANAVNNSHLAEYLWNQPEASGSVSVTGTMIKTGLERANVSHLSKGLGGAEYKFITPRGVHAPLHIGTAWYGIGMDLSDATSVYTGTAHTAEATVFAHGNSASKTSDALGAQIESEIVSNHLFGQISTYPERGLQALLYNTHSYNSTQGTSFSTFRESIDSVISHINSANDEASREVEKLKSDVTNAQAGGDVAAASLAQSKIDEIIEAQSGLTRDKAIAEKIAEMYAKAVNSNAPSIPENARRHTRFRMGQKMQGGSDERLVLASSGIQAFRIGDRAYFTPEFFLPDKNADTIVSHHAGMMSGMPIELRNANMRHLYHTDLTCPLIMHGEMLIPTEEGTIASAKKVSPSDRYSPIISRLKKIYDGNASRTFFSTPASNPTPFLQSLFGGNALVETGLFTHAVRHAKDAGMGLSDMVNAIGGEEMQRVFGDENSQAAKVVIDAPHKFVVGDKTGVSVSNAAIGAMSSPYVRMLITRGFLERSEGSPRFGVPKAFDSALHQAVVEHAMRGEYEKPMSQVSQEAQAALRDFFMSIPETVHDRIALEMSTMKNMETIGTAVGASMAYQLAEIQEQDPASFQHTIKKQFVPNMGPDGLGIRKAVDYCIVNSEHMLSSGTTATTDVNNWGFPVAHAKVFSSNMPLAVKTLDFWHGYFASLPAHEEISVPNVQSQGIVGPDYVYRGTNTMDMNSVASYMSAGTSILRNFEPMPNERFIENVHGFHQGFPSISSPIGLFNTYSYNGGNFIRTSLEKYDPNTEIRRKRFRVTNGETTLSKFIKENVECGTPDQLKSVSAQIAETPRPPSTASIIAPVVKDTISNELRRKVIRQQLAEAARSLGTEKVSTPAARFQISGRIPSSFMGMTAKQRYEFTERSTNMAFNGQGSDYAYPIGSQDVPRMGISWKRLSDGRIMINYSPDIDTPMLSEMSQNVRAKIKVGIPFRKCIGFDAHTGTIIPQSFIRMSDLVQKMNQSGMMKSLNSAKHIASLISFDPEVQRHYGKAIRLLSKDIGASEEDLSMHNHPSGDNADASKIAAFLGSSGDFYDPMSDTSSPSAKAGYGAHDFGLVSQSDHIIHLNNPQSTYATLILPADSKPEHVQAAIASLHMANNAYRGKGIIGSSNSLMAGFNFTSGNEGVYRDYARGMMSERGQSESSAPAGNEFSFNQTDSAALNYGSPNATALENYRGIISRMPNFAPDISEMSQRVFGSDAGYYVPDAERKLQLHGDREAAIRLLFPNREDLTHYAWDKKSGGNNISVVKKSGKNAGFLVGHDVVTGIDTNGNPKTSRKVVPFRTESDANAYVATISQASTEAHIPKSMFGEGSRYNVENLGQTKMIDGEIEPVRSLLFGQSETTNVIEPSSELYRVGDIEKPMTKQEALAAQRILLSNDLVSGKAPERGQIMLSVGGTELGEMERLVKNRMSFGTAGSIYRFASKAMRALAFGSDRNKHFKESITGQQMFDLMQFHGVSKHEMRVTGLADLLYRNKDEQMTRSEVQQFLTATYPMFGRHIMNRTISTSENTYHWPVTSSGEWANNKNTAKYLAKISSVENQLREIIERNEDGPSQSAKAISDIIRKSFKESLAETCGQAAADDIPADMHVADYILMATGPAGEKLRINPSTLELFRQNMISKYRDESIRQIAEHAGFDIGGLRDGFADEEYPAGMTHAEQIAFRNNSGSYDSSGVAHTGSAANWSQYASGLGPYHVHVLHGHVSDNASIARLDNYGKELKARLAAATDPKEISKVTKMLDSLKAVYNVRKALASEMRREGHWSSPSGTMQYSHLRTSDGASVFSTNIGTGISQMADEIASGGSNVHPIDYIEELQSDPYQRSTFGIKSIATALPADLKEAEGMVVLPKLQELNVKIEEERQRLNGVVRAHGKVMRTNRYMPLALSSLSFEGRFENSSRMVQHLMVEKAKSMIESASLDEHSKLKLLSIFQEDPSREVKVSKEIQGKTGLPPKIPTYVLDKSNPYYDSMCYMLGGIFIGGDGSIGNSINEESFNSLYPEANPNNPIPPNAYASISTDSFSQLKQVIFNEICRDEHFAALLPSMLDRANMDGRLGTFAYDYEALAKRVASSFEERIGRNSMITGTDRIVISNVAQDFKRMSNVSGRSIIAGIKSNGNSGYILEPSNDKFIGKPREWKENHALSAKRLYILNSSDYDTGMENGMKMVDLNLPSNVTDSMSLNGGRTARALSLTAAEAMRLDVMVSTKMGLRTKDRFLRNFTEALSERGELREKAIEAYDEIISGRNPANDHDNMETILSVENIGNGHEWRAMRTFDNAYDTQSLYEGRMGLDAPEAKHFQSRSMAAKLCELVAEAVVDGYSTHGAKDRFEALVKEKEELSKKANISLEQDVTYPNSIPLGEENAYRSMSINFLVMDALQKGKTGLAWADARHHRTRYSSSSYSADFVKFGNKLAPAGKSTNLLAYIVNHADSKKAHDDFFGKVARGELALSLQLNTHNNLTGNIIEHFKAAANEAFSDMFKRQDFEDGFKLLVDNAARRYANAFQEAVENPTPDDIGKMARNSASGDGHDDIARKLGIAYASNVPAVAIPHDKMHGYAVNYGIPRWMSEIQYAGQPLKSILAVSHDAFEIPDVRYNGASWDLYDKKSGKLLEGGINDGKLLQERIAQSSKYLGNVPFITNFIKQYGPAGGHVKRCHMLINAVKKTENLGLKNLDRTPSQSAALDHALNVTGNLNFNPKGTDAVNVGLQQKVFAGGVQDFSTNGTLTDERGPVVHGTGLYQEIEGGVSSRNTSSSEQKARFLFALYAMGLRDGMSDHEFAAAVAEASNFTSPLMVIKPEFPTQAHADNMKKLIINGIPLLSVAGYGKDTSARTAVKTFKNYIKPFKSNYRQNDQ